MNKWDKFFLGLAKSIASASKDPSTKCGAVIVDPDRRIISMGYNGLPRGVRDFPERYRDRDTKLKMTVHAEQNALLFARQDLKNCWLYTHPFMPCSACAGMIIQAGVKWVVSWQSDNLRWAEDFKYTTQMFNEARVGLDLYLPEEEKCELSKM